MFFNRYYGFVLLLISFLLKAENIKVEYEAVITEIGELQQSEFNACVGSYDPLSLGDTISGYYIYDPLNPPNIVSPPPTDTNFIAFSNDVTELGSLDILGECSLLTPFCSPPKHESLPLSYVGFSPGYNGSSYSAGSGLLAMFVHDDINLDNYLAGDVDDLDLFSPLDLQDWESGYLQTSVCDTQTTGRDVIAQLTKLKTLITTKNVYIDVRPKRCPNKIRIPVKNPNRNLIVALLGQADFNVDDVDLNSIRLEGIKPLKHRVKDITSPHFPVNPEDPTDCGTVVKDGYKDIRLKFFRSEVAAVLEEKLGRPANNGEVIKVTLVGKFIDGSYFEGEDYLTLKVKR